MVSEPRIRWRYAPRSKQASYYSIAAWLVVLGSTIWALVAHVYPGTAGTVWTVVIIVLAALNLLLLLVSRFARTR